MHTGLVEHIGDGAADALAGLGAARARAQRERERRLYELKAATVGAYDALRERGLTEARIVRLAGAMGMPLSRSVVAKLKSEGDRLGWRPPSLPTCRVIDAICRDRNVPSDLTGRRDPARCSRSVELLG